VADKVTVGIDVTNSGRRVGSAVVQVYVEPPPGDPARPVRHLAGFRRVDLAPGQRERVTIDLDRRAFASWLDGQWTVPAGDYRILIGRSSRDLVLAGTVH
jgi:beta-glucosidase